MIKKVGLLFMFFVCTIGAHNSSVDTKPKVEAESKVEIITRARKSNLHVIKSFVLPAKGCVHITAQKAPVYVDTTSKDTVVVAVRIQSAKQVKTDKHALCKCKMINDDILHVVTKETDSIEAYYISVPESVSVTVVSIGNIYARVPYARFEAKGNVVRTAFASSTITQIDETNRCCIQGLISNGKHFDHRPTLELDTQGDITIAIDRNGGLGYGSYLLTQLVGKIKNSWQELQEMIIE